MESPLRLAPGGAAPPSSSEDAPMAERLSLRLKKNESSTRSPAVADAVIKRRRG